MLSYTEGIIESIEEEGVLKKATEVGSDEKRDAIFMEKVVHFRNAFGEISRFPITKDKFKNELEVGKYYYVFSENENIKEIYKDEEDLQKNLKSSILDGNQKGEKGSDEVGFSEGCLIILLLTSFCTFLSTLEIGLPAILLNYYNLLTPLVGEMSRALLFKLLVVFSVLNFLGLCYWMRSSEKKELKLKNKIVADFRDKMKIDSEEKNIGSDVVLSKEEVIVHQ